ncbi:RICIN domain-containing protein [Nocardia sp. CY41]|uniref:RICIN domain-containing protein n=1 Tax=Nocardia sp. CY41 TaxID=2608686 RepID=UPI001359B72B|nr:RICIN domain-containing protein [Nocardia sp. CY41]
MDDDYGISAASPAVSSSVAVRSHSEDETMATTYQIINYETGQALAVDGDADSVTMQQRAADDDAQLWTCPVNPEEGDFDIVNKKTGGHLSAIRSNGRLLCSDEHCGWDLPDFPEISPIATSDDEYVIGIFLNNRPQLMPNRESDSEKWIFRKV